MATDGDMRARPAARVIGVGVTPTGWPALLTMVRGLTRDGSLGYVVVHRDGATPDATRVAEVQAATKLEVALAGDGDLVRPDMIHVVPADRDVELEDRRLRLDAPDDGQPPFPINRFLRSVSRSLQREAIGVVLGSQLDGGIDGELGLERIKEYGGLSVAAVSQPDLRAAVHDPGVIDLVIRADQVAPRLRELAAADPDHQALVGADARTTGDPVESALRDVLALVQARTGHDFVQYKRATLLRRIARRMQVTRTQTLTAYFTYLRDAPDEIAHLLRDFLISVTGLFRDPEAFEALDRLVFPKLFTAHDRTSQIRIWSAGCASGEEAYSLAMLAAEHAALQAHPPQIQIFATDIDEAALAEARAGCYSAGVVGDLSPARLERFFTRDGASYRVKPELREMVLFSPHNLLRDPPFSKLDLVTCRNLLIYFERAAQDHALGIMHFALRPNGYLMLGSSESIDAAAQQFAPIEARHRVYIRRPAAATVSITTLLASRWPSPPLVATVGAGDRAASFGELHHKIVELYAPPSILVNEGLDIVHVSEHAGRYLTLSGGEPTRDLLRLVHPGLRLELRAAIFGARQPGRTSDSRTVPLTLDGQAKSIQVIVRALQAPDVARGMLLVTFDEVTAAPMPDVPTQVEPVVHQLEAELMHTRQQLRSTVEQYETSVVELKASNEELHAMNEELRSASEEIETSKEELQSVNEELTTLNHELKDKIDEVSRANGDLQNLMTSTDIAVLFLDRRLQILRYTPRALDLFNVIPTDLGRPIAHLTHALAIDDLADTAQAVLDGRTVAHRQILSKDGKRYLLRAHPYRGVDGRVDGVVLTFLDITEIQRAEEALRASDERFRLALRSVPVMILTQDRELRYEWGYAQGGEVDFVGKHDDELFPADEAAALGRLKQTVLATGVPRREQLTLSTGDITRHYDYTVEPARQDGAIVGVRSAAVDITPSVVAAQALRDADRRKDEFLATLAHELRNPLAPIRAAIDLQALAGDDLELIARSRERMDRQVDQLTHLVDDLMDVSRISLGVIDLRPEHVTIGAIVEAALEATIRQVAGGGHTVIVRQPDEPLRVWADPTRLTQILTNLIANAARYTPTASTIELTVTVEPEWFQLAVRDHGMGIASEDLTRIFDKFHRSSAARDRKPGGLGIGLHLVRWLVELHGGKVEAHSDGLDQGAEVVLRMPIGRGPERAAPVDRRPPARRRSVLVVDDNREVTDTLAELIEMLGHEVRRAYDGTEALRAIDDRRPEVVFLDLGLPDVDGYEVARRIRARPDGAEIRLVVLSGWGADADVARSREAGVDQHMVKPAGLVQIREIVGDCSG